MDDYLAKAMEAEGRARAARDPDIRARWLGIAFGYRELSRYRNSLQERLDGLSIDPVSEQLLQDDESFVPHKPS